jgi:hypothetical protein
MRMRLRLQTAAVLIGTAGLLLPVCGAVSAQAATASTHHSVTSHKPQKRRQDPPPPKKHEPYCTISASPNSFVEQGLGAAASSVAFVFNVECRPVFSEQKVEIYTPQLYNACQMKLSWYSATATGGTTSGTGTGEEFDVVLDNDGNAEAVVWGGPSCAATSAWVQATLQTPPYAIAVTRVDIKPPSDTKPGLSIYPPSQVEDSTTSSVAAIFYAEFPSVYAEQKVEFSDAQLYDHCGGNLTWIGPNDVALPLGHDSKSVTTTLDNNGNAFVVALAGPSCASGPTIGTADLTGPPYKGYASIFWVLSPRVTV